MNEPSDATAQENSDSLPSPPPPTAQEYEILSAIRTWSCLKRLSFDAHAAYMLKLKAMSTPNKDGYLPESGGVMGVSALRDGPFGRLGDALAQAEKAAGKVVEDLVANLATKPEPGSASANIKRDA